MNFFKRALEYNNLAKSLNGIYQMLNDTIRKRNQINISEDLLVIAYISRVEIIDRIAIYRWSGNTRIIIPMMPGTNKTLDYALTQTIDRLVMIGNEIGIEEEIEDVLNKGALFYRIENEIPESIKKIIK